jgi:hypothetical protein
MRGRTILVVAGLTALMLGASPGVAHAQERYSARVIMSGCVVNASNGTQLLHNMILSGPDAEIVPPVAAYHIEPQSLRKYVGQQVELSGIARINTADSAKVSLKTRPDGITVMTVKMGWRTSTVELPANSPMSRMTFARPDNALTTRFDKIRFETGSVRVVREYC